MKFYFGGMIILSTKNLYRVELPSSCFQTDVRLPSTVQRQVHRVSGYSLEADTIDFDIFSEGAAAHDALKNNRKEKRVGGCERKELYTLIFDIFVFI